MILMVTGCLGFIGSRFTEKVLKEGHYVIGVDSITYAARPELVEMWLERYPGHFKFRQEDIATMIHMPEVDFIVNFAAETHVDNSIIDPIRFTQSNFVGVQNLLELIRSKREYERPIFVHISTDEVYGDINVNSQSLETDDLNPSSPYSASKAAADLMIEAYARTYDVKYFIIRPSNCYGEHQYPEKLIPKTMRNYIMNKPIPIHSDGEQMRCWLHTDDLADAIMDVMTKCAVTNEIFNVGGVLHSVNEVVSQIINTFDPTLDWKKLCIHDLKRPGIDTYYNVDDTKLQAYTNWSRMRNLPDTIKQLCAATNKFNLNPLRI